MNIASSFAQPTSLTGGCSSQIVYILGRRHCGSTILDIVLGNAGNTQGVGEVIYGLSRYPDVRVPNGSTADTHPFWRQVRDSFEKSGDVSLSDAGRKLHQAFGLRNLPWLLLASPNSMRVRELRSLLEHLYATIRQVSGRAIVVDSGKRVTQAIFLARFFPEARIVHLVRHPLSVMFSHFKRARWGETIALLHHRVPGQRVGFLMYTYLACNWTVGSALAWLVEKQASEKCLRLRFEDFLASPQEVLKRLGDRLNLDLRQVIAKIHQGSPMSCDVNLCGNPVRFESQLQIDPKRASAIDLPRLLRAWVILLSLPLLRVFGYRTIPATS